MGYSSERGVVLILVVIIVAILSTVVVDLLFFTRVDYEIANNRLSEKRAAYIARSGVNVVKAVFNTRSLEDLPGLGVSVSGGVDVDKGTEDRWLLKIPVFPVGDGNVTIVVEDERGKLNLNALVDPATNKIDFQVLTALTELFRDLGIEEDKLQRFIASLINWLDRPIEGGSNDQDPRGADGYFYQALDNPYTIKDGPLDSLEELKMIDGMDEDFYAKVKDYLTVYPPDKYVNFSTAPRAVIVAALKAASVSALGEGSGSENKIDDDTANRIADAIIEKRQNDPFLSRADVQSVVHDVDDTLGISSGLKGIVLSSGISDLFKVHSTGFIGSDEPVVAYVEAVLFKRKVGRSTKIDIISWKQR